MILLDTHVAAWLRAEDTRRLRPIRKLLEQEELRVSPFAVFELQVLFEIGRLRETGGWIAEKLREERGVALHGELLLEAVAEARTLSFTRDPFDRLIAGHALASGAELLTVDETLLKHVPCARWA